MESIKTYCINCKIDSNHYLRATYYPEATILDDTEITSHYKYHIKECMGCDRISFLVKNWESTGPTKDEIIHEFEYQYPIDPDQYQFNNFLSDEDINEFPQPIYNIYNELKIALDYEADILAGIGMRMVVEAICLQQKIPGRNLKDKISKLYERGDLSQKDFEIIDALREIGNISAHKIKSVSQSKIDAALEATNHLLRSIYIVRKRTNRLRNKTSCLTS